MKPSHFWTIAIKHCYFICNLSEMKWDYPNRWDDIMREYDSLKYILSWKLIERVIRAQIVPLIWTLAFWTCPIQNGYAKQNSVNLACKLDPSVRWFDLSLKPETICITVEQNDHNKNMLSEYSRGGSTIQLMIRFIATAMLKSKIHVW